MGVPEKDDVYLIELKGSDLEKAVNQIRATFMHLRTHLANYQVHGRVVVGHVRRPAVRRASFIALEKSLAEHGVRVRHGSLIFTEEVR